MCARASSKSQRSDADIWRDPWGIPHIKTQSRAEAFAALGFAHARDRLWQMEALLRRGIGRYAEWMGKAARVADVLARQVDVAGASQRDFAALGAEARAMLESYAARRQRLHRDRTIGRSNIGCSGREPENWLPWHSIAVMRQIGFLMGSVWWKLWRACALPIVGAEGAAKLRFDDGGDELLCVPPGLEKGPFRAALEEPFSLASRPCSRSPRTDVDRKAAATIGRSPRAEQRRDVRCWRAIPIACSKCRTCTGQVPSCLRRVRRHRPHCARRPRLSAFRSQQAAWRGA